MEIAQTILKKYGVSINPDKCQCTSNKETPFIEFMGANIGSHLSERQSLANKLFITMLNEKQRFKDMLAYGVPQSIALTIFRQCTVPKVNWGAFIEENNKGIKELY